MEGGKVKSEEIAALTENELRSYNPVLVAGIEKAVKDPLDVKIGEMEGDAAAVKPTLDLIPEFRRILGLADDVDDVTVLGKALASIREAGKSVRDSILETVLAKKFKDENTKKLVKRLIASEMDDVRDFKATGDSDKDEKKISEMVNTFIDGDDSLKAQVSEMEGDPKNPPSSGRPRNEPRELKPGLTTTRIRVRAAR
jgi:hypothetical protein